MTHPKSLALLSLLFLAPACGEKASVGDFIDSADGYARAVCECDFDNPLRVLKLPAYGSADECLADFPANSSERGCVEGLFKDEEVDYSAALECRAGSFDRAASCISAKTCTDTARNGCFDQLLDELEDCPEIADDVEQRLNDCLYN
jgi:hypothetical protein